MSDTETMRIERFDLPPLQQPNGKLSALSGAYATIAVRGITACVERFAYWDRTT
jgi:hypothetical protein